MMAGDELYDDDVTSGVLDYFGRMAGHPLTRAEARRQRVCVRCALPVSVAWSGVDVAEWNISALCPACFDAITAEPDE